MGNSKIPTELNTYTDTHFVLNNLHYNMKTYTCSIKRWIIDFASRIGTLIRNRLISSSFDDSKANKVAIRGFIRHDFYKSYQWLKLTTEFEVKFHSNNLSIRIDGVKLLRWSRLEYNAQNSTKLGSSRCASALQFNQFWILLSTRFARSKCVQSKTPLENYPLCQYVELYNRLVKVIEWKYFISNLKDFDLNWRWFDV